MATSSSTSSSSPASISDTAIGLAGFGLAHRLLATMVRLGLLSKADALAMLADEIAMQKAAATRAGGSHNADAARLLSEILAAVQKI